MCRLTAISAIIDYLADTAISPIQKTFVEIESPYASGVTFLLSKIGQELLIDNEI